MRTHLIAGLISLASATSTGPAALAQTPLWFTPKSPPWVSPADAAPTTPQNASLAQSVLRAVAPAQVAPVQVAPAQSSPNDTIVEVAYAPDLGLAVVNRLTDKEQTPQDPTPQAQTPQDQTPLLNTESMIGPLQSAGKMFSRLDINDGWLSHASLARSGPRADAEDYLWSPASYTWVSPVFYHHPLYFEQPNLERYGIGRARVAQPLLSSVHFFGSIPLVPYKTLTHHPRERVYTLGQGRPGNCVPVQRGVILGTSSVGEVSRFWHPGSGY